jgi:hypothetical protein
MSDKQTRIVTRRLGCIVVEDVVDDLVRFRIERNGDGRWEVDEWRSEWRTLDGSFQTQRAARAAVDAYVNGGDWQAA